MYYCGLCPGYISKGSWYVFLTELYPPADLKLCPSCTTYYAILYCAKILLNPGPNFNWDLGSWFQTECCNKVGGSEVAGSFWPQAKQSWFCLTMEALPNALYSSCWFLWRLKLTSLIFLVSFRYVFCRSLLSTFSKRSSLFGLYCNTLQISSSFSSSLSDSC